MIQENELIQSIDARYKMKSIELALYKVKIKMDPKIIEDLEAY